MTETMIRRTEETSGCDGETVMKVAVPQRRRTNREIASLALPWMSVLAVAIAYAAAHPSLFGPANAEDEIDWQRDLMEAGAHPHKPVFNEEHDPLFPLGPSDRIGFFLAVLGLMVAAGGGIGGGGILVPIYILVMGFSPKHAIPLSNVTVFGGAVANTLLNSFKRHPLADRPLVDWDLILVMEPLTIAGALIGAFLNKVLPELLLTVMLVVLLTLTARSSLKKAIKMYKKETLAMKAATEDSVLTKLTEEEENGTDAEAGEELLSKDNAEGEKVDEAPFRKTPAQTDLAALLDEERVTPAYNLQILIVMFVVVLAINLLKGGGAFPSPLGITCGSTAFWISNALMLGWIIAISIYVRSYLLQKYYRKKECKFEYVEGDIQWDERATVTYPIICCAAGFFAGMFGVGGGIVKGPLMLAMGVHPAVSSASSACMILFTSFTATTSFVVFGLLVPDYAVVCMLVGFFATLAGQLGLGYLMKKAQRNSYIAFSIGAVVALSAFLMTIQSLLSMAEGEKHHAGGICGKGD